MLKIRLFKRIAIAAIAWTIIFSLGFAQTEIFIGSQIWMNKNLSVEKFRNGDQIMQAKTNSEWMKAGEDKKPAWCYYNNDPSNETKYGKLYNWFAISDPRGLAPLGWHIPNDTEWEELSNFLGGKTVAGASLKPSASIATSTSNPIAASGFDAQAGGYRYYYGNFSQLLTNGYWWSSSKNYVYISMNRNMLYFSNDLYKGLVNEKVGYSVRCMKN